MNALNAAMTVIGAGSYGTALAITLARNGHHVVLWGHDPKHIATLQHDRCNAAFLPDVPFPDTLHLESDLATALAASEIAVGRPAASSLAKVGPEITASGISSPSASRATSCSRRPVSASRPLVAHTSRASERISGLIWRNT